MTIGEKNTALRWRMLLTQVELSEHLGVALMTVRKWERDLRKPKEKSLMSLEELFNKYNINDD